MKKTFIAILILSMTILTSCGISIKRSKGKITRHIELRDSISEIESNGVTDIEYTDGKPEITLIATKEMMDKITVTLEGNKLVLGCTEGNISSIMSGSKLIISYPSIKSFTTLGTGDIEINELQTPELTLKTYGTGDINCEKIKSHKIYAETGGTGDIQMGRVMCDSILLESLGTGDIDIKNISASHLSACTLGTGDINLAGICESFSQSATGSGDINYKYLKIK